MTRHGATVHFATSESFVGVRRPFKRRSTEVSERRNEEAREFRRKYPTK